VTSPNVVDQVAVEILADASKLAKDLKDKVEKSFKDLDPAKALKDSVKKSKPVPLPVGVEPDTKDLPEKVKEETKKRPVKVPAVVDPVLSAFQAEVRRQVRSLSKTIGAEIPVGADTDGLRQELSSALARIQAQSRAEIPVEVADRGKYETDLRAAVAAVSDRVKASVKVEPDTASLPAKVQAAADRTNAKVKVGVEVDRRQSGLGALISGLGRALPNFGGIGSQVEQLGSSIQRAAGSSAQLGGSLAGAATTATGPIGIVIGLLAGATAGMAALAGAAIAAVPAIAAVAGAAAAIPGALAGAGAAFGALSLGFKGISEAFKPTGGGGGGGGGAAGQAKQIAAASRQVEAARRGIAAANRQVEASERSLAAAHRGVAEAELRLADAQKRAVAAQAAISRAREAAVEDIEDLNRSLRGAQLSEEEAALGVTDALRELEKVRLSGNIPDIQRADLAYRQSLQTLEEAKDTTADLAKETTEANTKGVEGSEKVQDAYRDQEEALRAVRDAQIGIIEANDGLKSAQDGVAAAMDGVKSAADGLTSAQEALASAQQGVASGGGGVAKELIKLAPAAQAFVNAIKGLKPAFEDLRLDVQQRLFAGLDRTVTNLGEAWIPRLKTTLGAYADTFNGFFKDLGRSLTDTEFMTDLQIGAEGFRQGMDAIFTSVSQRLVPALGDLAEASAPFLKALGEEIANVVTRFSDWVQAGERSGALQTFFEKATAAMREIFAIGGSVVRIIGGIVDTIVGAQSTDPNASPLEAFRKGLDKVAEWLNNPKNQEQLRNLIREVGNAVVEFGRAADAVSDFLKKIGIGGSEEAGSAGSSIGRAILAGMLTGLVEGFKATPLTQFVMWFIDEVKGLFGIASPSTVFADIGRDVVRGFMGGISGMLGSLRTAASNLRITVTNAAASAGSWLVGAGRSVVSGLQSGIRAVVGPLSSTVSNLRVTVVNALSNAGNLLYNAGRAIIQSLINGLASRVNALGNYLGDIGQFIKDNKGPIEKDRVLLVGAGQAIMDGLIVGIDSRKGALGSELADVSALIANKSLPQIQDATMGLGWDADAAISRSLSVADQRQVLLGWKSGVTGSKLLDEIARMIDLEHGGDVQSALSRTSR
jgi:hypothetical protein